MSNAIGYLSGPVDARSVYDALKSGAHTALFGTSYLQHFFTEVERAGRAGVIITSHDGETYVETRGAFTIINRPKPKKSGLRYHIALIRWTLDSLKALDAHGAHTTVMTDAQHYWFVTLPFRRRGMRFINSFHCTIRPLLHRKFGPHEFFIRLTSALHLRFGDPTMIISPRIAEELEREPGAERRQTWVIIPDYPRAVFEECGLLRPASDMPVKVLFAGRVERNKGVFDLLDACETIAHRGGREVHFHVYGEGDALDELRRATEASCAGDRFHIHGFAAGRDLARHYSNSHIVVVPTRSEFNEGLAKSVIEGVLACRPVVTSRACPAIDVVRDACLEAELDEADSYADAIWRLATDEDLLEEKILAARRLRENFFDPPSSYANLLRRALDLAERS